VRSRISVLALATLLIAGLLAPAAMAQDRSDNVLQGIAVEGVTDTGTFEGVLDITGISRDGDQLLVDGVLQGTHTAGEVVTDVTQEFTDVEVDTDGRCPILFLDIGPIFLDLLGLEVDLSQIVLDITAVSGPGKLLGNLLCAIVHLLDGPPAAGNALDGLIDRLNQLLDQLLG
jgi:hypothetical protein